MLSLPIYGPESWNDTIDQFQHKELFRLELEHSLVSLSKWEAKFEKPFLGKDEEKSEDEVLWYIQAMHQGEPLPANFYQSLTPDAIEKINEYIASKQTATWFSEVPNSAANRETITAEIIYHWMIALNVPFECQHWHLNRLLTLIRVINEKNAPPKKMSQAEMIAKQRELNAKRKAMYQTKG